MTIDNNRTNSYANVAYESQDAYHEKMVFGRSLDANSRHVQTGYIIDIWLLIQTTWTLNCNDVEITNTIKV